MHFPVLSLLLVFCFVFFIRMFSFLFLFLATFVQLSCSPEELSSKRPLASHSHTFVSYLPPPSTKQKHIDPRFLEHAGEFNAMHFSKNYGSFLKEEKEKEIEQLKNKIKRKRDGAEKEEIKKEIQKRVNTIRLEERQHKEREALQTWKREERAKVKDGKKPFFLKKCKQPFGATLNRTHIHMVSSLQMKDHMSLALVEYISCLWL